MLVLLFADSDCANEAVVFVEGADSVDAIDLDDYRPHGLELIGSAPLDSPTFSPSFGDVYRRQL